MEYNLYIKYDAELSLTINNHLGDLCDETFADIMYATDKDMDEEEADEYESTKIGFMSWVYYNQTLARAMGVNMTQIPVLTMRINSKALMELDYACITQETIHEIGVATNQNIIVLYHFGISADWRNKGLGEQVLKGLIKQMKGRCGYIVILHSRPEQCGDNTGPDSLYEIQGVGLAGLENDSEKAQWKLNAFFQRCGFRQFKNYENVFVCNVEQVVTSETRMAKYPVL
jgi:hypothetical protein